jgi:hypothetical protein
VTEFKTIRAEIRHIVDEAFAARKPITADVIWGLLSRDVPEDSFKAVLNSMIASHQLTRIAGDKGKGTPGSYEPGPVEVRDAERTRQAQQGDGFHGAQETHRGARSGETLEGSCVTCSALPLDCVHRISLDRKRIDLGTDSCMAVWAAECNAGEFLRASVAGESGNSKAHHNLFTFGTYWRSHFFVLRTTDEQCSTAGDFT